MSAPVTWAEIEAGPPRFDIFTIWPRLAAVGDLFAPMLSVRQDLRGATEELRAML